MRKYYSKLDEPVPPIRWFEWDQLLDLLTAIVRQAQLDRKRNARCAYGHPLEEHSLNQCSADFLLAIQSARRVGDTEDIINEIARHVLDGDV